jgi:hypothetical protein
MTCASGFQYNIVRHVDPHACQCNKFVMFPLASHDKTSNKGMLLTITLLEESFELINKTDDGCYALDQMAFHCTLFFYGDALSVKKFKNLYGRIHRQLTLVGKSDYMQTLPFTLSQIVMQKGHFHQ